MTTGINHGEKYALSPTPTGEVRLTCRPLYAGRSRGQALAHAIGARCARRPLAFFMTPARAEKWRALFLGGYVARRRMLLGITGWGFESPAGGVLSLREVMRRERMKG